MILDIIVRNKSFRIICIYAPPYSNDHKIFFHELSTFIIPDTTFVLGDFNSVLSSQDRLSQRIDAMTDTFNKLISECQLTECQNTRIFTFQCPGDPKQQSHIDYIFGPKDLITNMYQFSVWNQLSDHSCVVSKPNLELTRGPGQWHFAANNLEDQDMILKFRQLLISELLKLQVRDLMQAWTKFQQKQKNCELNSLQ